MSDDVISRQAALDALGEAPEVWMDTPEEFATLNQWEMDVTAIEAVPSAQPEDKCSECDAWNKYKNYPRELQWIPCSERLPKENECIGNVWKYYLIQDEYEDMHVAHLSGSGWKTIESVKALECDVVAWMPLPEQYREDGEEE